MYEDQACAGQMAVPEQYTGARASNGNSVGRLRAREEAEASFDPAPKRIPGVILSAEKAAKCLADLDQTIMVLTKRLEQGGVLLPGPPHGEGGPAKEPRPSSQVAQVFENCAAHAGKMTRDIRELLDRLDI